MKTKLIPFFLLTLLFVACVCLPLTATAETPAPENLLAQIYARNNRS